MYNYPTYPGPYYQSAHPSPYPYPYPQTNATSYPPAPASPNKQPSNTNPVINNNNNNNSSSSSNTSSPASTNPLPPPIPPHQFPTLPPTAAYPYSPHHPPHPHTSPYHYYPPPPPPSHHNNNYSPINIHAPHPHHHYATIHTFSYPPNNNHNNNSGSAPPSLPLPPPNATIIPSASPTLLLPPSSSSIPPPPSSSSSTSSASSSTSSSSPPSSNSTLPPSSSTPSSSIIATESGPVHLEDVFSDLFSRFLINLPDTELSSTSRVMYHMQEAYWFYIDLYCNKYRSLPRYSHKGFCSAFSKWCPPLHKILKKFDKIYQSFREYLESIPVSGVLIINPSYDKLILVHGIPGLSAAVNSSSKTIISPPSSPPPPSSSSSSSLITGVRWGFPRGKIDENENEMEAAIRECREEIGYDCSSKIKRKVFLSAHDKNSKNKRITLYIIEGVEEKVKFETKTRGEIGSIKWVPISSLPTGKYNKKNSGNNNNNNTNNSDHDNIPFSRSIYLFADRLKEFISYRKKGLNPDNAADEVAKKHNRTKTKEKKKEKDINNNNNNNNTPQSATKNNSSNNNNNQFMTPANNNKKKKKMLSAGVIQSDAIINNGSNRRPNNNSSTINKFLPSLSDDEKDINTFGTTLDGVKKRWNPEDMFAENEKKFGLKSTVPVDDIIENASPETHAKAAALVDAWKSAGKNNNNNSNNNNKNASNNNKGGGESSLKKNKSMGAMRDRSKSDRISDNNSSSSSSLSIHTDDLDFGHNPFIVRTLLTNSPIPSSLSPSIPPPSSSSSSTPIPPISVSINGPDAESELITKLSTM